MAAALLAGCGAAGRATVHRQAPGALGPYSGSVESDGLVFVSGKIGPTGGEFAAEAEGAIDALEQELLGAGLALADVVSVTVYLTGMEHYAALNEVYARRFRRPYPARACVALAALPGGARVEIQAVARRR